MSLTLTRPAPSTGECWATARGGRPGAGSVDFFGHQISLHLGEPFSTTNTGKVGERLVPMPHLGLVLLLPDWQALADRLVAAGVAFVLPPQVRFRGEPGEQWTMFFRDPSGNPIEVKGFAAMESVFKG